MKVYCVRCGAEVAFGESCPKPDCRTWNQNPAYAAWQEFRRSARGLQGPAYLEALARWHLANPQWCGPTTIKWARSYLADDESTG